jgi:hypothetical protein
MRCPYTRKKVDGAWMVEEKELLALDTENIRLRTAMRWVLMNCGIAKDGNHVDPHGAHSENYTRLEEALKRSEG